MKHTARTLSALSLALILGACGTSGPTASTPTHAGTKAPANMKPEASPTKWFVELAGDPDALSTLSLGSQQATFRAQAAQQGIRYQEVMSFQTLFNGFSVKANKAEIGRISQLPGVLGVYPVRRVTLPKTQRDLSAGLSPDMFYAKGMTGADIAQNELGLSGTGVKVGVIDSGMDLEHPAFAGRIVNQYDFVGDAYNADDPANNIPIPDQSADDCGGHGTHVAGIVGGNDAATGFKGVAPGVSFGAYKVFGCDGTVDTDVIIAAMTRALNDGMQVINMSLGSAFDAWAEGPDAKAASRLVKRGVVVVTSAGNSGESGQYSIGTPGTGENVISVASIGNTKLDVSNFTITPDGSKIGYLPATGAPAGTAGTTLSVTKKAGSSPTTTNDGCTVSGGFAAGSLTGQAVLIRRGTCTFYEKASNAQKAGAAAVILYNNAYGYLSPTVEGEPAITIPVVSISAADGAKIDGLIAAGLTMTFNAGTVAIDNPTANTLDSFSSFGMTAELEVKPDIAAPGGNIRSAWPLTLGTGGYEVLSGTSMASPHVAGAAALMLQAFPTTKSKDMRTLLMNPATLRYYRTAAGAVQPTLADYVQRQGAGMVDIVGSYKNKVRATPSKLSLGESAGFGARSKVVVLKNTGTAAQTYAVKHVPALTVEGTTFAPKPAEKYATMSVNGTAVDTTALSVTIPAGGETELNVTITPPAGAADKSQYGGYLSLVSTTSTSLVVPYSGFNGDYQSIKVLGNVGPYDFPALYDPSEDYFYEENEAAPDPIVYTFQQVAPDPAAPTDLLTDQPTLWYQLSHQSRLFTLEVLNSSGSVVYTYSSPYNPRNATATGYYEDIWDGKLTNGTNAPNGTYQMRIKVLKALGDPGTPSDTETYTSQQFTVARP